MRSHFFDEIVKTLVVEFCSAKGIDRPLGKIYKKARSIFNESKHERYSIITFTVFERWKLVNCLSVILY